MYIKSSLVYDRVYSFVTFMIEDTRDLVNIANSLSISFVTLRPKIT